MYIKLLNTEQKTKFKQQKLSYFSFVLLMLILILMLPLTFLSNDKPLLVYYQNKIYTPIFNDYTETTFGGGLAGEVDYLEPFIQQKLGAQDGLHENQRNWVVYTPNTYSANTINYFNPQPNPSPPSKNNYLGTDDSGRDILARLLYALRLSLWFGIVLACVNICIGCFIGVLQGYFGGKVDLYMQRVLEVWGNVPEMYLLIIIASIIQPNIIILFILFSLFSWLSIADYIRLESLKVKQMDYIKAAKVTGLSHTQIICRHMTPNILTPLITFFPFKVSQGIVVLTALDFLGLGLPQTYPSMGHLLAQAKNNLEAWWISVPTVLTIAVIVLLLTFIGEGLRKAFDVRV